MATGRVVDPIYLPFTITTPLGTQIAAPQTTQLPIRKGILESVDITIPNGHVGATGLQIQLSGQAILPYGGVNNWIIGDAITETFAVGVEVDTKLQVVTYNLGKYAHKHYLRLRIRQLASSSGPPTANLIDLSTLNMTGGT